MHKNRRGAFIIALLAAFLLGTCPAQAAAPVSIEIPVQITAQEQEPPGRFTIELVAEAGAPLPADTEGDRWTYTAVGNTAVSVGPILYTHPGQYQYTLRAKTDSERWENLQSGYTVLVSVFSDDAGDLAASISAIRLDDGAKADTIVFPWAYNPPHPNEGSDSGDSGGSGNSASREESSAVQMGSTAPASAAAEAPAASETPATSDTSAEKNPGTAGSVRPVTPNTGESTHPALFAAVMFLSGGLLLFLGQPKKKNKQQ